MLRINKLILLSFGVLIVLIIVLGLSACSPLKTAGKTQISINVNTPKPVEIMLTKSIETFQKSHYPLKRGHPPTIS